MTNILTLKHNFMYSHIQHWLFCLIIHGFSFFCKKSLLESNTEHLEKCFKVRSSGWQRMQGGWMEYQCRQEFSINKWQWPRALSVRAREGNKGNRVSVAPSEWNMQKSVKIVTRGFQRSICWDRKELHTQQLNVLWVKTHMFKSCTVFVHVGRAEKGRDAETSAFWATQAP